MRYPAEHYTKKLHREADGTAVATCVCGWRTPRFQSRSEAGASWMGHASAAGSEIRRERNRRVIGPGGSPIDFPPETPLHKMGGRS